MTGQVPPSRSAPDGHSAGALFACTACYDQRSAPRKNGPVAQLGARLNGIQEVTGSIPVRSTIFNQQDRKVSPPEGSGRGFGVTLG